MTAVISASIEPSLEIQVGRAAGNHTSVRPCDPDHPIRRVAEGYSRVSPWPPYELHHSQCEGRSPVGVSRPPGLMARIDSWAKREGAATRADRIRRLVDQSIAATHRPRVTGAHKGASRARQLAGRDLDRLGDQSTRTDEHQK